MEKYLFSLLVLLTACSMPETRMYSLSLPAAGDKESVRTSASVNIIVHAPRYLTQSYIAFRVSPYQLDISRYSKWEAPPEQIVKETLRDSLSSSGMFRDVSTSSAVSSGFYSLEVNLKRFERSDEGTESFGELVFDARLFSPEGKEIYRDAVSKKVKLQDRSFLGLAKALSAMLSDGQSEITSGIAKVLSAESNSSLSNAR